MKARTIFAFLLLLCIVATLDSSAQMIKRTDVVWARTTTSAMTVDGVLNEAAWASAESVKVVYGIDNGMPGSGWFKENGLDRPLDSTKATVKFLVKGDSMYVAIIAKDKSVGGGPFNKFDGILSNLRQRQQTDRPVGSGEIFYAWCKEDWADTLADRPGRLPAFLGFWGSSPYAPRPDSLNTKYWAAATTVQGTQNNDADVDVGWTMEIKINLRTFGYNVTQAAGDIIMYSLSIYDADYQWPLDTLKQAGNRVWFQCPWGNAAAFNHIRLYARPDVGITGTVPVVPQEITIPGAGSYAAPTIDGRLTEPVWGNAGIGSLRMKYGDAAIRNAYPSTAPYRSGQFQPTVNGGTAAVTDPNLVTVKYFYKADTLFLGFDVNDRVVQAMRNIDSTNADRYDGMRVVLCQRNVRNGDNVLFPRRLTFRVWGSGTSLVTRREDDLAPTSGSWDSAATKVQVAIALKGGTTIDTLGATADSGYTAEMKVILPQLGYAAGRGDGVLFLGILHYDGDSFGSAVTSSYGTRTWFMREGDFNDGAAWCYMDPTVTLGVNDNVSSVPAEFKLLGNYPNPFNPSTTIKFTMPQTSEVTLEVFDVLGRLVSTQSLGIRQPGEHSHIVNASKLASGVYNYRLTMASTQSMVVGKMMLVK